MSTGADTAPAVEAAVSVDAAFTRFIAEGHHERHPCSGGAVRLMTLHELNRAFRASLDQACPYGTASALLRKADPALHAKLAAMAPAGYLIKEPHE